MNPDHTSADPVSDAIVAGHARNFWQGRAQAAEAEVDRLRGILSQTAHDIGEEGYAKWSSDLHRAMYDSAALDDNQAGGTDGDR